MSLTESISRLTDYLRRNGIRATVRRSELALRRTLFSGRMVIFYRDLSLHSTTAPDIPASLSVQRVQAEAEMSPQDHLEINSVWNPKLAEQIMKLRFKLGASLWLIRSEGVLAGYGWTLPGRTVEPHYFPLGKDDVQLLDFHVFPKFRGRALDWVLMTYLLHALASEGKTRAYGEAAEWNKASIASFGMNRFRRLGSARKITLYGRTIVWWTAEATSNQIQERGNKLAKARPSTTVTRQQS